MPEASPRSVVGVGGGAAQPPGQPVVGQQDPARAGGDVRLGAGGPAQLGGGDARDRDGAHRLGPRGGPAELLDQRRGVGRGPGVVPQQRVAHRLAVLVEQHHPVLLARDPDRRDVAGADLAERARQRVPPGPGIDLRAVRVRTAGPPAPPARPPDRRRGPWWPGWRNRPRRRTALNPPWPQYPHD